MLEIIINKIPYGYLPETKLMYRMLIDNLGSKGDYDCMEMGYRYRIEDATGKPEFNGVVSHLHTNSIFKLLAHVFVALMDTRHIKDYTEEN